MKKILIIGTGGTIAIKPDRSTTYTKLFSINEILSFAPSLKKIADVDAINLMELGSNDLQPAHWLKMAETIKKYWNSYDGFVITHGTDTMHYTASALSFLIQNPSKPIVLTFSSWTINRPGTYAKKNL